MRTARISAHMILRNYVEIGASGYYCCDIGAGILFAVRLVNCAEIFRDRIRLQALLSVTKFNVVVPEN